MNNPIGNSFSIPEHLTQSVKKLLEQKESAYQSAKMFMSEAEKHQNSLNSILEQHIEVLKDTKYVIDGDKMIVTILEKK